MSCRQRCSFVCHGERSPRAIGWLDMCDLSHRRGTGGRVRMRGLRGWGGRKAPPWASSAAGFEGSTILAVTERLVARLAECPCRQHVESLSSRSSVARGLLVEDRRMRLVRSAKYPSETARRRQQPRSRRNDRICQSVTPSEAVRGAEGPISPRPEVASEHILVC